MKAVVLSDLRIRTILIALSIKNKSNESILIISEATINFHEYGSESPKWYKKIKISILKSLYDVRLIKVSEHGQFVPTKGIKSSIISRTYDHTATEEKYPIIAHHARMQSHGANDVWSYLNDNKIKEVYIFNGRLASSEPIAACVESNKSMDFWFYEWGNTSHHYTLSKNHIHDIRSRSLKALRLYEIRDLFPWNVDLEDRARDFMQNKLKNRFTSAYKSDVQKKYDVTIFLSSPHEFLAIDQRFRGVSDLDFVAYFLAEHCAGKRAAIRMHPNMQLDPESHDLENNLRSLVEGFDCDVYSPASGVDSYSLIRNSDLVAVNGSSIAVDAYFLDASIYIHDVNQYRLFVDYCDNLHSERADRKMTLAKLCIIDTYVDQLPMGVREIIFDKLFRPFDTFLVKEV